MEKKFYNGVSHMNKLFSYFVGIIFFVNSVAVCAAPIFSDIKINSNSNNTNIEITSTQTNFFMPKLFILSNPARLVIDFKNVNINYLIKNKIKRLDLKNTLIKDVRAGHPTSDRWRVVFDLENNVSYRFTSSGTHV